MKTRRGFVSNSSSSSFIIATKKDELSELFDKFSIDVPEGNPLAAMMKPLIADIVSTIQQCAKRMTQEKWLNYYGYDSVEDALEEWGDSEDCPLRFFKEGWNVYIGSFANDTGDGMEAMLCDHSLNYKDENFVMIHEGGY
jgi:hypothetical protein